jgi:hypothetical protein
MQVTEAGEKRQVMSRRGGEAIEFHHPVTSLQEHQTCHEIDY